MTLETHRWVRVRWETDRRYYEAHLHQDLWGTWVLTRTWGGRRSAQGKTVHQPCADQAEGQAQLAALYKTRRRHGYRVVLQHPPGPANFR